VPDELTRPGVTGASAIPLGDGDGDDGSRAEEGAAIRR
jgi:hypothetical protein